MPNCSSCGKQKPADDFISARGFTVSNCTQCRERYNRSHQKNKEKLKEQTTLWKTNNKEYIQFSNSFYNQTKGMKQEDRKILFEALKKEKGFENQVVGKPSSNRKEHYEKNGVMGKEKKRFPN